MRPKRMRRWLWAAVLVAGTALTSGPDPAVAGPYDYGNYPSYLNPFGEGYGADCGSTRDTLPAIEIANNGPCYASLTNESHSQPCADPFGCDVFTAEAGLDDAVVVRFGSYCRSNFWYPQVPSLDWYTFRSSGNTGNGHFTVTEPGAQKIVVNMGQEYEGGYHVCGGGRYGGSMKAPYTIYADVVPNTRPAVSVIDGPTRVLVGEPATFRLSASDVDGNLEGFRAKALSTRTEHTVVAASSDTVSVRLHEAQDVELTAHDAWGVRSDPVYRHVEVYQDDCGTGGDIDTRPLALGESCTGYLAKSLGDDLDTYTVEVPAGVSRLSFSVSTSPLLTGSFRVLTPDGRDITVLDGTTVAAVPGTWTIRALRQYWCCSDRSAGSYTLRVDAISGPVAPALTVAGESPPLVAGQWTSVDASAVDVDGRNVRLTVDWGDGAKETTPWSASGQQHTFRHAYAKAGEFTVTVTASSLDSLTTTRTLSRSISLGADSCAEGDASLTDAPESRSGWSTAQGSAYTRSVPATCSGWISVFRANGSVDINDVVRLRASALAGTAVDLTARAGPTDQLVWRVSAIGRNATVTVFNDEWHRIVPGGSDTIRAPLPLDAEYIYVEFANAPSAVTWSLTAVPSSL
jgi:hypothetical protein